MIDDSIQPSLLAADCDERSVTAVDAKTTAAGLGSRGDGGCGGLLCVFCGYGQML